MAAGAPARVTIVAAEKAVQLVDEHVGRAGFDHERVASGVAGRRRMDGQDVPGERHDRHAGRGRMRFDATRGFPAVDAGKRQIHHDDIRPLGHGAFDRVQAVGRLRDSKPGELQVHGVHLARIVVILDDENVRKRRRTH